MGRLQGRRGQLQRGSAQQVLLSSRGLTKPSLLGPELWLLVPAPPECWDHTLTTAPNLCGATD